MTRIVLVDDQPLLRAGFRMILSGEDDLEVVGEAGDGDEGVAVVRDTRPDVVLMDIRMPSRDGLSATAYPSGVKGTPVEIAESQTPLLFWRKELRPDSGGAGRHRGGMGQVIEIESGDGLPFDLLAAYDRIDHPPRGRDGGANGAAGYVGLKSGTRFAGKGFQAIPPGEGRTDSTPARSLSRSRERAGVRAWGPARAPPPSALPLARPTRPSGSACPRLPCRRP